MNINKNDINYEQVIDLRDIISSLWKRKKLIIGFSLLFAFITAMISMFIIPPVYDAKLSIIINMPESYSTRYGEYLLPITTNEQYINLFTSNDILINTIRTMEYDPQEVTLENLRKRINIRQYEVKSNTEQNTYEITVSSDNPQESLKLAQTLYDNYIEFMDAMTKERAINYYLNNITMEVRYLEKELDKISETLKKNEELLLETPKLIANHQTNIEIRTQLNEYGDYVIPINTINPNYIKIENDIIGNKQEKNDLENSIRMKKKYLEELEIESEKFSKYYQSNHTDKFDVDFIGVVETSIYLPSPPVAPTKKTSPSNSFNTIIGAALGGIIGITAALKKEYW